MKVRGNYYRGNILQRFLHPILYRLHKGSTQCPDCRQRALHLALGMRDLKQEAQEVKA